MTTGVQTNLRGLQRLRDLVRTTGRNAEMDALLKQVGVRYLSFARKRYRSFARGGGDWKPLAESTIRRRRNNKYGRAKSPSILIDTGILLGALNVGAPGNLIRREGRGIRVGIGGPTAHKGSRATIADIAGFHNEGGSNGRPPQRKIIVPPDAETRAAMNKDVGRAIQKIVRACRIK